MPYKVVRYFQRGRGPRTISTGLTLEEAQRHCKDPESSSSTCYSSAKRAYTKKNGPWFDGYTKE